MLSFRSLSRGTVVFALLIASTGCLDTSQNGNASGNSGSSGNNNSPGTSVGTASVSGVSVSNNAILINGTNLNSITALQVNQGSTLTKLLISKRTATQIQATATSALTLVIGAAYSRIVSTADAQSIIPIIVQAADNSLSPTVLTGGSATVGQILQWNGTSWAPSSISSTGNGGGTTSGPTGSLVILNSTGGVAARLIQSLDGRTALVSLPTGEKIAVDIVSGKYFMPPGSTVGFTGPNCTGNIYAGGSAGTNSGLIGEVFYGASSFYKVTGFATSPITIVSYEEYDVVGQFGTCVNHPLTSLGCQVLFNNPSLPACYGLALSRDAAPQDLSAYAPLNFVSD